jgi:hypothetical protein
MKIRIDLVETPFNPQLRMAMRLRDSQTAMAFQAARHSALRHVPTIPDQLASSWASALYLDE